jgi:hypothetical protein
MLNKYTIFISTKLPNLDLIKIVRKQLVLRFLAFFKFSLDDVRIFFSLFKYKKSSYSIIITHGYYNARLCEFYLFPYVI